MVVHRVRYLLFYPLWRRLYAEYRPIRRQYVAAVAELFDGEAGFDASRSLPMNAWQLYCEVWGLPWRR